MKKEKGITLIALVITIIVLLILAGITLSLVIGENGMINRSKQGGEEYTKASLKEELQLKIAEIEMETLAKGESLKRADLQKLSEIGAIVLDTGIPALGEYKDYDFEVDENFEVTIGSKLEGVKPTANAEVITTGYVTTVEIKVTASTTDGTITNIEATNGATLKTNTSDTEKFFEVTKNGIYYFKITGSNGRKTVASIEVNTILEKPQISVKDIMDNEVTLVIDTSYPEEFITEYQYYAGGNLKQSGTKKKEYLLTGLTPDTTYTNIYVKAFYPGNSTGLQSDSISVTTQKKLEEMDWANQTGNNRTMNGKTASYRNPVIPVGFETVQTDSAKWKKSDAYQSDWNEGLVIKSITDGSEFVWIPVKDGVGTDGAYTDNESVQYKKWNTMNYTSDVPAGINKEEDQIKKYGGFYVARYEASYTNQGGNNVEKPISKKGKPVWGNISPVVAQQSAELMYQTKEVQSGLITGTQWESIMRYLKVAGYDVESGSAGWGNRWGEGAPANTVIGFGTQQETGYSEIWKAKNIYDIYGNAMEWTTEHDSTRSYYYIRGGQSQFNGGSSAVGGLAVASDHMEGCWGYRVVLYLG